MRDLADMVAGIIGGMTLVIYGALSIPKEADSIWNNSSSFALVLGLFIIAFSIVFALRKLP